MKKKLIIAAVVILVVGIGVSLMLEEPVSSDNRSGNLCPQCKSTNVGTFFYGLYREGDEESATIEKVKSGVLIPGGCVLAGNAPKYRCNDCGYTWGNYSPSQGL